MIEPLPELRQIGDDFANAPLIITQKINEIIDRLNAIPGQSAADLKQELDKIDSGEFR